MMNTRTILENWDKNPTFPRLPDCIYDFIPLSFQETETESLGQPLENYLNSHIDQIMLIIQNPPFTVKREVKEAGDLIKIDSPELLRNILLVGWFNEENSGEFIEFPGFRDWASMAFLSGYIAYLVGQLLLVSDLDEIFILSFMKNVFALKLFQSFPKVYNELIKMPITQRLDMYEVEKIAGFTPGELSAWVLQKWGFTEQFCRPLIEKNVFGETNLSVKILHFSGYLAEFILNRQRDVSYKDIEKLFKKLFNRNGHDFQAIILEILRVVPKQAAFSGYTKLENLTLIEVMKEHLNLLDNEVLSYRDLMNETVNAHKRILHLAGEVELLKKQLEKNHIRDTVTGLYNHAYFREFLHLKINEAIRYEYPITLILFDLDDFHIFNHKFGFSSGNELLHQLANVVRQNIRQSDILARLASDEFGIILPYTGLPQSKNVSEKILHLISNSSFTDNQNTKIHKVTVSIGYASLLPKKIIDLDDKLIGLVKKALINSKKSGGNFITQADV
jgi:diguanylate cyclase (GGDEF)-like protein